MSSYKIKRLGSSVVFGHSSAIMNVSQVLRAWDVWIQTQYKRVIQQFYKKKGYKAASYINVGMNMHIDIHKSTHKPIQICKYVYILKL